MKSNGSGAVAAEANNENIGKGPLTIAYLSKYLQLEENLPTLRVLPSGAG